jgi:hypothetical protein
VPKLHRPGAEVVGYGKGEDEDVWKRTGRKYNFDFKLKQKC